MSGAADGLLREVAETLRRGPARVTLRGVVLSARPFLAAALHSVLDAPLLVVTPGSRDAERFHHEAAYWLARGESALLFPAREVLPFEPLSPEPEISSTRIATLAALAAGGGRPLVVAPLEAALGYLIPRGKLLLARLAVARGAALDGTRFRRHLLQWGYRSVDRVDAPGELAQRGGIVDLFPPGEPGPVRIELFGDEVESIHRFDPDTQRNGEELAELAVLPAREVFLDSGVLGALRRHMVVPTSQTNLPRDAILGYQDDTWTATASAIAYQTLQDPLAPVTEPYRQLPQIFVRGLKQNVHVTDWLLGGDYANYRHPDLVNGQRLIVYPQVSLPLRRPWGYVTPKAGFHYTNYNLSANDEGYSDATRSVPLASVYAGLFFDRPWEFAGRSYYQTLEPRLFYVYVPFRDQSKLPNFSTECLQ